MNIVTPFKVKMKYCKECKKYAVYNVTGERPAYCGEHRKEGMVNVMSRLFCKEDGCKRLRMYGVKGGKAEYCAEHRTDDMIVTDSRRCITDGCIKHAMYGMDRPEYCATHKKDGMINMKVKLCVYEGCKKQASHSKDGCAAEYCGEHKAATMENVVTRRCAHEGCKKFNAVYGVKGTKERYCAEHKANDMVLVARGKCCSTEGCKRYGVFKNDGDSNKYCGQHRSIGMRNILNRVCMENGCEVHASFDMKGGSGKYCLAHKKGEMINVMLKPKVEKNCVSCGLKEKLNRQGQCEYCRPATFKVVKYAKQNALMEYLDARELVGSITDQMVEGGMCGKERPDRVFDFGDKIVILECDENQHKERQRECELSRMKNIGQSFGGLPVYFIRWNPDAYICCEMVAEKVGTRHKRLGDLIADISEGVVQLPPALVAVYYMYYNGWSDTADVKWDLLTHFES